MPKIATNGSPFVKNKKFQLWPVMEGDGMACLHLHGDRTDTRGTAALPRQRATAWRGSTYTATA